MCHLSMTEIPFGKICVPFWFWFHCNFPSYMSVMLFCIYYPLFSFQSPFFRYLFWSAQDRKCDMHTWEHTKPSSGGLKRNLITPIKNSTKVKKSCTQFHAPNIMPSMLLLSCNCHGYTLYFCMSFVFMHDSK